MKSRNIPYSPHITRFLEKLKHQVPGLKVLIIKLLEKMYVSLKTKSIKVGLSPSKKKLRYLLHWKPLKNDEKCFLFHLKSSFCSQDI